MVRRIFLLCLICLLSLAFGCKTANKTTRVSNTYEVDHSVDVGQTKEVQPGGVVAIMVKGENFDLLELKNNIRGTSGPTSCDVSPQAFTQFEDDGTYLYAFSDKDLCTDNFAGAWDGLRCGIRYNKLNSMDTGVVVDARPVGGIGNDINFMDIDGAVPEIEMTPMVNTYAENYLRREIKFESYKDGYLTLYSLEEKGSKQGYDAQGNRENVKPEMFEKTQSFDLTESKTVEVLGAQIEIIEATPDKLVYKVLSPLASN